MTDPNDWAAALQRIAELESQLAFERERYELLAMDYAGADADRKAQPPAPDPSDLVRIAELEAAVRRADAVVETLSAERDDALNSLGVLRVALGAPDDSEEHGTRRSVGQLNRRVDQATSALTYVERLTAERDAALERLRKAREWLSDGHTDLITLGGILRHD